MGSCVKGRGSENLFWSTAWCGNNPPNIILAKLQSGEKQKKHPGPFGYLVLLVLKGAAWGSSFGGVSS
jgi:hypothetical protein